MVDKGRGRRRDGLCRKEWHASPRISLKAQATYLGAMPDPLRVCVIGGGIAGAELIRLSAKTSGLEITLVEPKRQIECQALYPDYLGGLVRLEDLSAPLQPFCNRMGARLVRERAVAVNSGRVICEDEEVECDVVVVCVGAEQNYFGIPGAEHTFSINTLEGTLKAREFIEDRSPDRIMIVGSGLTGIEAASVLAESLDASIYVVEMMDRLLPAFPQSTSALVEKILYERGVNMLTGTAVKEVRPDSIVFGDGSSLDCDMAIWTTGIKPPALVEGLDLPKERGWILVDPYLRAKDEIFALGDCAWIRVEDKLATKTGIEAERQAKHMADNLSRMVRHHPLVPYSVLASTDNPMALISTGCGQAVGVYGGLCVSMPSWLIHSLKSWIDKSIVKRYKCKPKRPAAEVAPAGRHSR